MKYLNYLTIILVLLKITHLITLGWLLVLLPSVIYFTLAFVALVIVLILVGIYGEAFKDELKDKMK